MAIEGPCPKKKGKKLGGERGAERKSNEEVCGGGRKGMPSGLVCVSDGGVRGKNALELDTPKEERKSRKW